MNGRLIKFRVWAKRLNYDKYKEFDKHTIMPLHPQNTRDKELYAAWLKEWGEYNEARSQHVETCYYHKMVYPANFDIQYDAFGWTTQGYLDTGAIADGKTNLDFEPDYVLMQYTGLNDATGREIYEGDIISLSPANFEKTHIESNIYFVDTEKPLPAPDIVYATGVVKWNEDLCQFDIKYLTQCESWKSSGASSTGLRKHDYLYTVIGNEFENRELFAKS